MRRSRRIAWVAAVLMACGCGGLWYASRGEAPIEPGQAPQAGVTTVVLVHGLGRTAASMEPLAEKLAAVGFDVRNWDYPSTQGTIESHSERLRAYVSRLDADPDVERIHFVTHSLGGIIVRHALTIEQPGKMGRVVMLAPPNKGSASAGFWAPIAGGLVKPLSQLTDESDSAVNQLGVPHGVDIGVIAAASDGKVDVEDTHLEGEADHCVVPGYHSFIMCRRDVAAQIIHFLRAGRFDHDSIDKSIEPSADEPDDAIHNGGSMHAGVDDK
ncbi:MAG: alpha/beta fold hydrolase [Phycisphaerales bacterium]|nr:alpha/beta fold hydrolase [Phycisphaerales bacterium]MCB9862478.1 alpha/beta fold hydrolase [Phycisphaerales bacterium]